MNTLALLSGRGRPEVLILWASESVCIFHVVHIYFRQRAPVAGNRLSADLHDMHSQEPAARHAPTARERPGRLERYRTGNPGGQ